MKLYPNTKVYIQCPGNFSTGGSESLHQLASALISFGVEAYMFYYQLDSCPVNIADPVHDFFKKYHVPYTFMPEDNQRNVLIVPETYTEGLYRPKKIRCVIWWMAVDNYFSKLLENIKSHLAAPLREPVKKIFAFGNADKDVEHWAQSEYVCQFLTLNGVKKFNRVETHMSQYFLSRAAQVDLSKKENIVAYNPKKGFEFTKQLIELAPDIDWRPIQNMTPAQVQELLAKSKVYIDFGEFPGRERLPREAILSGCVVITGKRGAAANDVDVNIPADFKFDSQARLGDVIKKIREVFDNFEAACSSQKAFRDKELNAQRNFHNAIATTFGINKMNRGGGGILLSQGFSDASSLLTKKLQSQSLVSDFIVDDVMSTAAAATLAEGLIFREQNRNYLRDGKNFTEIITRDDARFLYLEGRIKKFALLNPTDNELAELKDFYGANDADVLIFD